MEVVARTETGTGKRYQNRDELNKKLTECYSGTSLRHSAYISNGPRGCVFLLISICHELSTANSKDSILFFLLLAYFIM